MKKPGDAIKKNKEKAVNTSYVTAQIAKALTIASVSFIPFTAEKLWRILKLPCNVHEQEWNKNLNPV